METETLHRIILVSFCVAFKFNIILKTVQRLIYTDIKCASLVPVAGDLSGKTG